MKPQVPLQYCSIAFAVMWGGWMFWSSDSHGIASLVIWTISGAIGGYLWYLGMRWSFRRMGMLPSDGAAPGADRSAS